MRTWDTDITQGTIDLVDGMVVVTDIGGQGIIDLVDGMVAVTDIEGQGIEGLDIFII